MKPPYKLLKCDADGAWIYCSPDAQSKQRGLWVGAAIQSCPTPDELLTKERLDLRTEGHESALVEFTLAYNENAAIEVDILDEQSTDFPDTQPQAVENGEDHVVGVAPVERTAAVGERPSGRQQSPRCGLIENERRSLVARSARR
jgi:hypothetical protein